MLIEPKWHCFPWRDPGTNNCNTYFFEGPPRILIDPGHRGFLPRVQGELEKLGYGLDQIDLVLGTHCHPDHIEAVSGFDRRRTLFGLHRDEWKLLAQFKNLSFMTGGLDLTSLEPEIFIKEGELQLNGEHWQLLHCPGHSPGSICIFDPQRRILVSGDVVFKDGIGRVDLPGGNARALKKSISRLPSLEARFLLPGHGEPLIGEDRVASNFEHIRRTWFDYL